MGPVANANSDDVDAAVRAAHAAFSTWRAVKPSVRGQLLRTLAARITGTAAELGWLDSLNTGNRVREMAKDVHAAAARVEYFAGVVHEAKSESLPMCPGILNYSLREPLGVVARLVAYNHPLMPGRQARAGRCCLQYRDHEAAGPSTTLGISVGRDYADIFPPGVVNIVTGDRECGQALISHALVKKAGSTQTGRAILRGAAAKIMPVILEGGKNPFIICPDADVEKAIDGAIGGMNFTWAGQSCGSTSRCFVHRSLYEKVLRGAYPNKHFRLVMISG